MKAVIMAGGEGTRLRPLTSNQPKPMLPVANRPMMEHIIRLLREHGFEDIVVTVAFLANNIRSYFGDGSEFGVRLSYAAEESPLGTAGSVGNARDQLDGPFLAISGDVLTDIDLSAVVRFHEQHKAMATIGLKSMDNPLEFGIVITRPDGSIDRFLEKPNWGQVFSDTINTGIYVLEPEIFDFIAPDQSVDFSSEVFPALLEADKALFGYVCEGYWEDVGTLDAYIQAHQDCLDGKVEVDVGGFQLRRGVWLGEGCEVDPSARIEGPAVIGDYCDIGPGAHIGAHSVLGANVRIAEDVVVERAIVHDHSYLGPSVRLRGCVVGRTCDLRRAARCDEGVVVADDCLIGEHAVINAGVKIYPSKTVESGAIVNSSIVWESRGARSLFGRVGVSGLANVDMTPELAVKVAMSFGTTLKKGTTVTTSRDSSRAARVLKRAIMVGLNASGINVDDLEVATVPVTRFEVARGSSRGGITVRLRADDPESVVVRFFDDNGIDLDESAQRKIERLFFREDFRRALASEIGDIGFPPRALEHYTAALMASVDLSAIRAGGFKLVVDYAYGTASFVMPN
ncbi:MAG: sugar phosphate nucleotidyltransferase, partial [Acidimicrobiales bacterium]